MRFTASLNGQNCRCADAYVYYLMYTLEGRGEFTVPEMASYLDIGEDCVRAIADILREWEFVTVRRSRMGITEEGRRFMRDIPLRLVSVEHSEYVIGRFQQAVLVMGGAEKVTNGMYQRDSAIVAGANGATVMTVCDGDLMMPPSWNMDVREPELAASIRRSTSICEGDALVIAGASDRDTATISSLAVGLDML